MIDKGQLQIIKGRVSAIEAKKDAVYLTLGKAEQLIADHVVNCTGAAQNPLAVKMINSGLVAADVTGRAVRVNEGLQIIDKDGQPLPGIWAAGAMTAGSMGDVIGAGAIPKQIDRLISVLQAN